MNSRSSLLLIAVVNVKCLTEFIITFLRLNKTKTPHVSVIFEKKTGEELEIPATCKLHTFLLINFFCLTEPPTSQEIPIPFVVECVYFLGLHIN